MHNSRVILLRTSKLTDTSLIVYWMSEEFGLLKTVAKGALRPKSTLRGRLDLFFTGEMQWVRSKSSDLHTLREFEVEEWRIDLRRSYLVTMAAGYFCNLLESSLENEQPEPDGFDLLARALKYLECDEPSEKAIIHFERELAKILGIYTRKSLPHLLLSEHLGYIPKHRKMLMQRLLQ